MATIYLKPGLYRVRFTDGWAYFYDMKRHRVWNCNQAFALEHFTVVKKGRRP